MNSCPSPAGSEGVAAQGGGSHRGATQAISYMAHPGDVRIFSISPTNLNFLRRCFYRNMSHPSVNDLFLKGSKNITVETTRKIASKQPKNRSKNT